MAERDLTGAAAPHPPAPALRAAAPERPARQRPARRAFWAKGGLALLLAAPLLLFVPSLMLGQYNVGVVDTGRILLSPLIPGIDAGVPDPARTVVLRVRLPRVLAALLIGSSLASTGAAFQGIFKNPLVDSNVLGVSSGAGFGAALALSLFGAGWQVPALAFVFGLVAVALAFLASRLYQSAPLIVLTLAGILIGSLFTSLTSLLKYVADPLDTLPAITFWLLGGLVGVVWADLPLLIVIGVGGAIVLWLVRWRLNVLSLGDAEATALGLRPEWLKGWIIVWATLMTAAAVSVGGVIVWVGLVIPHAGRLLVGPDHRRLLPVSLSLGASFLLLIDNLSRTVLPAEVPLGILTGLVGVPILIVLLRRRTGW